MRTAEQDPPIVEGESGNQYPQQIIGYDPQLGRSTEQLNPPPGPGPLQQGELNKTGQT